MLKEQQKRIEADYNKNIIRMQKAFEKDIQDLRMRKQDLREIQKKYFKSSEKYTKEKRYYWDNFEKAQTKDKLDEMHRKKQKHLREYKKTFEHFRSVYDKKNLKFEERSKAFLAFDTQKKKDYMLNWDLFTKKLIEDIEFNKLQTNKWTAEDIDIDCDALFRSILPEMGRELANSSRPHQRASTPRESSTPSASASPTRSSAARRCRSRPTSRSCTSRSRTYS